MKSLHVLSRDYVADFAGDNGEHGGSNHIARPMRAEVNPLRANQSRAGEK